MRHFAPSPMVIAPAAPLYMRGMGTVRRRRSPATIHAPVIPLRELGARGLRGLGAPLTPAQEIGLTTTAASAVTTAALTSSAAAATAAGTTPLIATAFIPVVGVAIAVLGAVIAGLWSAHAARAKGAKNEAQVLNSAIIAFDGSLKAIFAAANSSSAGTNISAQTAIQQLQTTLQNFWAGMAPAEGQPGTADASHGGAGCASVLVCNQQTAPGLPCNKSCTAGCCVGCDVLTPTINQAIQIFQNGGGTLAVCPVYGSKYGTNSRASYTLTYAPPALSPAASELSAAGAALTSGGAIAGIPLWAIAVGLVAFLALR